MYPGKYPTLENKEQLAPPAVQAGALTSVDQQSLKSPEKREFSFTFPDIPVSPHNIFHKQDHYIIVFITIIVIFHHFYLCTEKKTTGFSGVDRPS